MPEYTTVWVERTQQAQGVITNKMEQQIQEEHDSHSRSAEVAAVCFWASTKCPLPPYKSIVALNFILVDSNF